jgi:putative ABC transport system permease protein
MIRVFFSAVRLAFVTLARNKTRAALTMLGILIGVAAVMLVTALAATATDLVGGQLDSFASNAIFINPRQSQSAGARRASARLTDNDAKAILREGVSLEGVAPFLATQAQVVYGDRNIDTQVIGTTLPYYSVRRFSVDRGAVWTESDEVLKTKVCVIGQTVATKLFGGEDPVGRVLRIGRAPYRVIGVMAPKGNSPFGDDQDDRIMMPIGSYRARVLFTWGGRVDMILASSTRAETTDRAIQQISEILRHRHRLPQGAEDDFRIGSQTEIRSMQQGITGILSALLLGVAAVSLVVGGVGIMNIMLVSVSERTREIGIRMSIGAREGDILTQFLVEALVLSSIGGLMGIAAGIGGAAGIGFLLDWRVVPQVQSMVLGLAVSATIGVAFGFLPARRAAKMDPIEALRME